MRKNTNSKPRQHRHRRKPVDQHLQPTSAAEAREAANAKAYQRAAAMRTLETASRRSIPPQGMPSAASLGVLAWNRLGFGPGPGDLPAFDDLGADDDSRLQAFLDQQLDPDSIDDSAADAKIAAAGYQTLHKNLTQLWRQHAINPPDWYSRIRPAVETTFVSFLRGVHSKRQLFEVMTEFWHNHFSVYGWDFYQAPTWVYYDRDVIRRYALGNFRAMLGAVAKSTPMLLYLDNYLNSADGPNENWARELLELHTLGDENYWGTVPRNQVPVDGDGIQVGFCDEDVFAVTRAFTGWGIEADPWWDLSSGNGGYEYRSEWHDTDAKNVLGEIFPAGQQEADGEQVLDLIAAHPGTAKFISRKLCRKLIGDFPPESVVDAAAQTFLAAKDQNDQIAQVVRTIALSQEFRDSWGAKVKRPFEVVVSALRSVNAHFPFIEGNDDSESFDWQFSLTGHYPFAWHPPNGYPDFAEAWVSSSPRVMTWRLSNWLVDYNWSTGNFRIDILHRTPDHVRSATELADYWINRMLGRPMSEADRMRIIEFMAQGHNQDLDLPLDTDEDTQERLQSMIGLIFLSPEFQWR